MTKLEIWCDGACQPNPGGGGYAALLRFGEHEKLVSGTIEGKTTNQRAEITAAIEAFKAIKEGWLCDVTVYSDSQYLVNIMNGDWAIKSNADLFQELDLAIGLHTVEFEWIRGHSGQPENERCNAAAEKEATKAYNILVKQGAL